jgi:16S rRNA (guanine527-N7)-methyltransferase
MSDSDPLAGWLRARPDINEQIQAFIALFLKWNKSINLSAVATRDALVEHLVDSLHVVEHLDGSARVLDVGSGGGLPVVAAAIYWPEISFTALEPVHKKHAFLRTAARELGLVNLDSRAERLDDHQGRDYDAAMSRATFELGAWLDMAMPYVRPDGLVIGFEGLTRDDLPASVRRTPYELGGKTRAIVTARRPTTG